ncbi:MBL fold metallo-hydrolase [Gammaproteobacteria bacterium 45_16_T64]|nr:MBL fold metallo-hydrolase [Gammaproteobacteria bacterium 45_16_T64]
MSDFTPGNLVTLSPLVHRVVANNAGMMTGPGTNTYLIGTQQIAVIDPGPANAEHIDAILAGAESIGGSIQWILCTHTHIDHSPGAALLKAKTNAIVCGLPAPEGISQDTDFRPDQHWHDGSELECEEFCISAIHTPGHASNHLCFLLNNEELLFTGDHLMNGSTVVISPPDGNMQHYLQSLEKLKNYNIRNLAPAHGDILPNPSEVIEGTIKHRLQREQKVIERLTQLKTCDIDTLTSSVYDDVPAFLHPIAKMSLLAHLEKLSTENKANQSQQQWSAC